jgi:ABC-type polysaccharide/polyol phosphate transport system ATPase subunit
MLAIKVANVHKKFKVYYDKGHSLKEKLLFRNRNHYEDRWVLKGVSFEVEKGEAVGIIGENGSGKSTLLKLLTKIMYPDNGTIEIEGRVSSLIELGAGFHPDMSGRENIYTNAAIFGLTRPEIDNRLNDIIGFSELEEFINNPVRTYSSGMYMRLAFSVAINVDADVLLIDEILSVGDASFQAKCFSKLREIKASGTTIVIVSHSLGQIEQICDKSIWIDKGVIRESGNPRDVHPDYMEFMGEKSHPAITQDPIEQLGAALNQLPNVSEANSEAKSDEPENKTRWGNRQVEIIAVKLCDKTGVEKHVYKTGDEMDIFIEYKVNKPVNNPVIGIGVYRNDQTHCYGTNTHVDRISEIILRETGTVIFRIIKNNLLEGEYLLDVAIHAEDGFAYDYFKDAQKFRVYAGLSDVGVIRLDHEWIIN